MKKNEDRHPHGQESVIMISLPFSAQMILLTAVYKCIYNVTVTGIYSSGTKIVFDHLYNVCTRRRSAFALN